MKDPFKIDSPTCISFSGGRTSAYMLWRVLQANGGLPDETIACFANTGLEAPETYTFIEDCARNWNVPIVWVEYRADKQWAVVEPSESSRNGEPFEQLIRDRNYLPNPVTRICTYELKIRTMNKYIKTLGWPEWDSMVGIRADEMRRVAKIRARPNPDTVRETMVVPLADANINVRDVTAFWDNNTFDLQLKTPKGRTLAGNSELCFLKPANQIFTLIQEKPERAIWWARMEALALASKPSGARFRSDRPTYAQMLEYTKAQGNLFDPEEEGIPCFCGD
jgi:3'-phosphoadenosine 5'-phosphosulfate sulfotransferase (PAPS reductase)/FAD synthetase